MTQFNDSVVKAALRYASDEGLSTTSNNFNDLVWLSLYNYLTGTVGLVLSPTVSLNKLITLTAANYLSVPWGQMDQLVFDALGVYLQGKVDPIPGSLNGRIIAASEFFSNRPVGPPPPSLAQYIGSLNFDSTTSLNPSFPPGTQAGDLMIICVSYSGASGATFPSGWNSTPYAVYTSSQTMTLGWKVLTETDINTPGSIQIGSSASACVSAVYRGPTGARQLGYTSNPSNTGAVIVSNGTPGADAIGSFTIACDRDTSGSENWHAGSPPITGWTVKQNRNGTYSMALADTLGADPNKFPSPLQANTAWVVTNSSFGECGIVWEMFA